MTGKPQKAKRAKPEITDRMIGLIETLFDRVDALERRVKEIDGGVQATEKQSRA